MDLIGLASDAVPEPRATIRGLLDPTNYIGTQGHGPATLDRGPCALNHGPLVLGWSFTTSHLVEQGTLMRPLDHVAATEFAFYVIGGEAANFTKDKLRFINWIMP